MRTLVKNLFCAAVALVVVTIASPTRLEAEYRSIELPVRGMD